MAQQQQKVKGLQDSSRGKGLTGSTALWIGCGGLALAILLCALAGLVINNLQPLSSWLFSEFQDQPAMALAVNLGNGQPRLHLYVGDARHDRWVLPQGRYHIETIDEGGNFRSAPWQEDDAAGGPVNLAGIISTRDGEAISGRREELLLVANLLVSIHRGELAYLSLLSQGFSAPLSPFSGDFSAAELASINEAYAPILSKENETVAALLALEGRAAQQAGVTGCPGACSLPAGLLSSLVEFFSGAHSLNQNAVEDILSGSTAMSPEEKAEAFQYLTPAMTGGAASFDEMIQKLQNGELTGEASRIRAFLSDEESFYNALQEGRATNRPLLSIAHEEGALLVEKGAQCEVEIIKNILQAAFSGIEQGFAYAEQADEWAEFAYNAYHDPLNTAADYASGKVTERIAGQISEALQEMGLSEEEAGELSEQLSEQIVGQLQGHDEEVEFLAEREEAAEPGIQPTVQQPQAPTDKVSEATPIEHPAGSVCQTVEEFVCDDPSEVLMTGGLDNKTGWEEACGGSCWKIANEISLRLNPCGGSASGSGTYGFGYTWPEGQTTKYMYLFTFSGECTPDGCCRGTATSQSTVTGYNSDVYGSQAYSYQWEGQYFEGTIEGVIREGEESRGFLLTK